jgi:hypothetical protein
VSRSVDLNLLSSQRSIAMISRKQRIAQAPYFQSLHRAQRKRENRAFHEGIQLKASNKSRSVMQGAALM